jgi:hypothetical protein
MLRRTLGILLTTGSSFALACTSDLDPEDRDALELEADDEDLEEDPLHVEPIEDEDADEGEDAEVDEDAPVDQDGFTVVMTPEGPQVVGYAVDWGGKAIVDGDIVLGTPDELVTPEQYASMEQGGDDGVSYAFTPIPIWGTAWANDQVRYVAPATPFPQVNANINSAIAQLDAATDLTFIAVDPTVASLLGWNHIRFAWDPYMPSTAGSSDSVGVKGGAQYISLGSAVSTGLVIHELGHAIGLYHEHQRPDRDAYVTFMPACVQNGKLSQFDVRLGLNYGVYDKASIMHYGPYTWSIAPGACPTLIPASGGLNSIGSGTLSPLDIQGINTMY